MIVPLLVNVAPSALMRTVERLIVELLVNMAVPETVTPDARGVFWVNVPLVKGCWAAASVIQVKVSHARIVATQTSHRTRIMSRSVLRSICRLSRRFGGGALGVALGPLPHKVMVSLPLPPGGFLAR